MAAGSDPIIGSIEMWPSNFAPAGWHLCDGSILPISGNDNLFSVIGTTYGGNGINNFALPDLRGRVPVGIGQGTGLPNNYTIGQTGGEVSHTLTPGEMTAHSHQFSCIGGSNDLKDTPVNNVPAQASSGSKNYAASSAQNKLMAPSMVANTGGGLAHNNMQPYLAMYFIIAMEGIYPQKDS